MALNDLKLTFRDEFNSLSLDTGTSATEANFWNTTMYNGTVRSLYNNGELQWYVDPDHNGLGINPFSVKDGILTITARPTTAAEKSKLYGYNYVSGALTSEHEFSQKYGYFEIRAQVSEGKGLWPAFWLLADHNGWPPEIDVMESIGDQTNYSHQTVHTDAGDGRGKATWSNEKYSAGFHTYGVDWTKDMITFYIDGKQTWSMPTPGDMHTPMYMLMNLAVGGSWAGPPNSATKFPAEYKVDYVRVYQHTGVANSGSPLPPTGGGSTTPPPSSGGGTTNPPSDGGGTTNPPTNGGGTTNPPTENPPPATNPPPQTNNPAPLPWGVSHVTLSDGSDISGASGATFKPLETEAGTTTYSKAQMGISSVVNGTTVSVGYDSDKDLTVVNNGTWNGIKNAALKSSVIDEMTVKNFVGVNIDMTGNQTGVINVTDVKKGLIVTGSGNDTFNITGKTNTTGDHALSIRSGDGNDKITYDGDWNNWVAFSTGNGADQITMKGGGGQIAAGHGNDRINIHTTGEVRAAVGWGADVVSVIAGAHATISDFNYTVDRIELKGVTADDVNVRRSGNSTLIDLDGKQAITLSGVALNSSQINFAYA